MNINPDLAKEIPCKNVLIYGYCKYAQKGCVFAHPSDTTATDTPNAKNTLGPAYPKQPNGTLAKLQQGADPPPPDAGSQSTTASFSAKLTLASTADAKRKFNMNTPSFQPSVPSLTGKFAGLSPNVKAVPVFVPSGMDTSTSQGTSPPQDQAQSSFASRKFNASTPSFTPSSPFATEFSFASASSTAKDAFTPQFTQASIPHAAHSMPSHKLQQPPPLKQPNPYLPSAGGAAAVAAPNTLPASTDFMFHSLNPQTYALNFHLYAPAPPPRLAMPLNLHETNAAALFIPNDLRETITKKNEATLQSLGQLNLPEHVGVYHSLVPINSTFDQLSSVYQLPSSLYKVTSNIDGLPYALRRIDHSAKLRIASEQPFSTVKRWRALKHPNVVRLHDAFTSVSLGCGGEPTLCLVYDFYPLANTLQEEHVVRKPGSKLKPVHEDLIWTYLVQLTSALITIHEAGLHAGSSLHLSKILVTNKNRVRLGAVCVDDVLESEALDERRRLVGERSCVEELQLADIVRLSKVLTDLASTTLPLSMRASPTESLLLHLQNSPSVSFSEELIKALLMLSTAAAGFDLQEFFARHLLRRALLLLNGFQDLSDYYEGQLLSEVENGRLFRLMAKLNFLVDRPEDAGTVGGNAFVLKLFYDFLFQAVDEYGKPSLDLLRLLVHLNKLDVGVEQKLLLVSRDEDSCIVVSYKEVKDILEVSFRAHSGH